MIAIVDSGGANLASLLYAFDRLGEKAELIRDRARIEAADRVVLPGVGAARRAMQILEENRLGDCIRKLSRPVLGVCLGMQLLFDSSEEGNVDCLGLIPGRVSRFPAHAALAVPHMGWNRIAIDRARPTPLLEGIEDQSYFYFVHSYRAPADGEFVRARTIYGEPFAAVVERENLHGVQFHPERSSAAGARLLRNFASLK